MNAREAAAITRKELSAAKARIAELEAQDRGECDRCDVLQAHVLDLQGALEAAQAEPEPEPDEPDDGDSSD